MMEEKGRKRGFCPRILISEHFTVGRGKRNTNLFLLLHPAVKACALDKVGFLGEKTNQPGSKSLKSGGL